MSNPCNTQAAVPLIEHPPQVDPTAHEGKKSYGQILKSSALIGGSSVVGIGIGIIRTKAMALFLGPAGVGLMGLYSSILDLTNSLAGMGINSSGVRQIAEAVGSGETGRIARTVAVLRRTAIVLGVLGALLLIVSSREVSRLTFGSDQHTAAVAVLALAVFFGAIAGGQGALIQGMRRISDLAKMGVLGNLFGVMISVPLVYFFREDGIVPSLVAIAAMGILTSWWYSRKVQIQAQRVTLHEVKQEASALLKLGFVFMASGVLTMGAAYAIRLIVLRKVGFEAAGLYQSAWALGGMYVAFITQSMVADFYPRLTAVARDNAECNRLVNEQAEISQLLAGPGVIATMTFAPLVIAMFYSSRFAAAVEPLRWICFGMALRVIAWPMGFIILAKGLQTIFFWVEVGATVIHVGLAFMFVGYYGLPGATIAFFGLYVCYGIFVYVIVRRLSGFRWCAANRRIGLLFVPVITVVFCSFYWLPFWVATTVGSVATLASAVYSIRLLVRLMPMNRIPRPIRQLLVWLRIAPSGII